MRSKQVVLLTLVLVALGVCSVPAYASSTKRPVITSMSSHAGTTLGGSLVTVHGRYISPHLTVTFLGRQIGYRRLTPSAIRVRVPAHSSPGPGWLRVHTSKGGTSKHSKASRYTYRYPPPLITSMSTHLGSTSGLGYVTLRGRFLDDVRSVAFGTVRSASFGRSDRVQGSPELMVSLPAHAQGKVAVIVTTSSGSSRPSAASAFEFYPYPSVTSLSVRNGSVTGGQTVTIRGTGFRSPASVHFGSATARNVHVVNSTTVTSVTPPHAGGVVHAQVSTPIGTSGSGVATTYRYGVQVVQTWSAPQTVDAANSISQIACREAQFCMATDSNNRWLAQGPSGWSAISANTTAGAAGSRALSCTSATFCMSATLNDVWTWDGAVWTQIAAPTPPTGSVSILGVQCTSATFCLAVTGSSTVATWDGTSWSALAQPFGTSAGSLFVSCWANGACMAVEPYGSLSVLNAGAWTSAGHLVDTDISQVTALRCTAPTRCMATTHSGAVLRSGSAETERVLNEPITHLECASDTSCVAAGATTTATWDGTRWSTSTVAPGPVTAISCPATDSCVVASGHDVRTLTW